MSAARDGITHSQWNKAILTGIAEVFRDAVLEFCQHPTLQFQWMRYLPSINIVGEFWSQLRPKIVALLKESPVLRSRRENSLKRPYQLKIQTDDTMDEKGDPLFDDLAEELYLSQQYALEEEQSLRQIGVQSLSMTDILLRVQADLSSTSSKIKSTATSEDWHTRAARLLMKPFENGWPEQGQVQGLGIIPLQSGSWVAGSSGSVFNPQHNLVPVPTDLGLRLVKAEALLNRDRHALFSKLGLKHCLPKDVLVSHYDSLDTSQLVGLKASVTHLQYLFWNLPIKDMSLSSYVYIFDKNSIPIHRVFITDGRSRTVDDLYFESNDEYGPKSLFAKVVEGDTVVAPGFPAHFVHPAYSEIPSTLSLRQHISWEGWLESSADIQRVPRLAKSTGMLLSDAFLYLIEHRRRNVVGTLKEHWAIYSNLMKPQLVQALSKVLISCEETCDTQMRRTYMPLRSLKRICTNLGAAGQVPFVKLAIEVLDDDVELAWKFLQTFQVRFAPDLEFYLHVLRSLLQSNKAVVGELSEKSKGNLFVVYEEIEKHSNAADHNRI